MHSKRDKDRLFEGHDIKKESGELRQRSLEIILIDTKKKKQ